MTKLFSTLLPQENPMQNSTEPARESSVTRPTDEELVALLRRVSATLSDADLDATLDADVCAAADRLAAGRTEPTDERCARCKVSPVNPETECTIDPTTGLCASCAAGLDAPEGGR